MSVEDDEIGRERERDQREASESRMRRMVESVSGERRDQFWLQLGFNVKSEDGFKKLLLTLGLPKELDINVMDPADVKDKKEALAWAVRAQKRAATFGTRLLSWLSVGIGIIVGLIGILKYIEEWRGH